MMIGNDIVKIDRMQKIYENRHLFDRIFTKDEQEYINSASSMQVRYERMAGKIAVKEAVAKAFGVGIASELSWLDIQTSHKQSGKPLIIKTLPILKLLQENDLHDLDVSISHMDNYATAVCLVF